MMIKMMKAVRSLLLHDIGNTYTDINAFELTIDYFDDMHLRELELYKKIKEKFINNNVMKSMNLYNKNDFINDLKEELNIGDIVNFNNKYVIEFIDKFIYGIYKYEEHIISTQGTETGEELVDIENFIYNHPRILADALIVLSKTPDAWKFPGYVHDEFFSNKRYYTHNINEILFYILRNNNMHIYKYVIENGLNALFDNVYPQLIEYINDDTKFVDIIFDIEQKVEWLDIDNIYTSAGVLNSIVESVVDIDKVSQYVDILIEDFYEYYYDDDDEYAIKEFERDLLYLIVSTLNSNGIYYKDMFLIEYIYDNYIDVINDIKDQDNQTNILLSIIADYLDLDVIEDILNDNIPEELLPYYRFEAGQKEWQKQMGRAPRIKELVELPIGVIKILSKHFKTFMKLTKKYDAITPRDKLVFAYIISIYRQYTEQFINIIGNPLMNMSRELFIYDAVEMYNKWNDVINIDEKLFSQFVKASFSYIKTHNNSDINYSIDGTHRMYIMNENIPAAILTIANKNFINEITLPLTPKTIEIAAYISYYKDVTNMNFAIAAAKANYNAIFYTKTATIANSTIVANNEIIPNFGIIKHKEYTIENIKKGDWHGLFIGAYTDCCQHPAGAGESCSWYGTKNPDAGFIAFKKDNNIIGQSFVWVNNDTVVMDNIEVLGDVPSYWDAIIKLTLEWANRVINETKFNEVRLGVGYVPEKIKMQLVDTFGNIITNKYQLILPKFTYHGYTDIMEGQLIVATNKKEIKTNETIKTGSLMVFKAFKETILHIEREVFPEDMQYFNNSYGFDEMSETMMAIINESWYFISEVEDFDTLYITDFSKLPEYKLTIRDMITIRKALKEFIKHHEITKIVGHFRKSTSYKFLKILAKEFKTTIIENHDKSHFDTNNEEYVYAEIKINN